MFIFVFQVGCITIFRSWLRQNACATFKCISRVLNRLEIDEMKALNPVWLAAHYQSALGSSAQIVILNWPKTFCSINYHIVRLCRFV
jgi:hypothetical protein